MGTQIGGAAIADQTLHRR